MCEFGFVLCCVLCGKHEKTNNNTQKQPNNNQTNNQTNETTRRLFSPPTLSPGMGCVMSSFGIVRIGSCVMLPRRPSMRPARS